MKAPRLSVLLSSIVLLVTVPSRADPNPVEFPDILTYKNGDRVQGRVVSQADGVIVYATVNLGELRVRADAVTLSKIAPPPAPVAAPAVAVSSPPAATAATRRWWREPLSIIQFAARLHQFFGPWDGRFSIASEIVSDASDRTNLSAELRFHRKWKVDETQLSQRYDYNKVDDVTTTDVIRANGFWRHDLSPRWFVQYRPSLDWNRATLIAGVFSSYVLLQQDFGAGVTLLNAVNRKLRFGLAQDLFDNWNTVLDNVHTGRSVQSSFAEAELKLPWRMSLTERAVYYYSFRSQQDGWENQFELSKKFTETLSTALRHELRRHNPDGRTPDQEFLRLLLGLDF